jgi:hypothetical protein
MIKNIERKLKKEIKDAQKEIKDAQNDNDAKSEVSRAYLDGLREGIYNGLCDALEIVVDEIELETRR